MESDLFVSLPIISDLGENPAAMQSSARVPKDSGVVVLVGLLLLLLLPLLHGTAER